MAIDNKRKKIKKYNYFRTIAENMRSGVMTFDMQKKLTFVNRAFTDLTGFNLPELDNDFINCIDPSKQDKIRLQWVKCFEKQDLLQEVEIITKSGQSINLSLFSHPLLDDDEKQVGVYIRFTDMLKYNQENRSSQQLENNVRKAIFSAPFPAVIVTEDGETMEVNQAWTELTGHTLGDIPNFKLWMQAYINSPAKSEELFYKLIQTSTDNVYNEVEIQIKNQSQQIWQLNCSRLGTLLDSRDLFLFMGVDITERKLTETRLVESERKLRLITNNIKSAVLAYSNRKELIYVNPGFEQLTNSKKSVDTIYDLLQFVYPGDVDRISQIIDATLQGQTSSIEDFRIKVYEYRSDLKWVSSVWSPLLDEKDQQIGLQVRITDVTEKKLMEEALKNSEANIKAILNNTSQCFMLVTSDYLVQSFNKIANNFTQRVYGMELAENINLKNIISKEDKQDFKNCFEFALQGYPITIERNLANGDKKKRDNWFELSFIPVYEEKNAVNSVCVGIIDINIRKKATQILEASEKRFKSLVQNSSDITAILDKSSKIKYLSPAVTNLLGYKSSKLISTNYVDYLHPEDRNLFFEVIKSLKFRESVKLEYRFKNKNNEWVYLQSIVNNLCLEPSIRGIVVNSRDITETKKVEDDLNESKHFIQGIANSMPNILYLYDVKEAKTIYVNKAIQTILGYDPKTFDFGTLAEFAKYLHPEDQPARLVAIEHLLHAKDEEVIESEYRLKDVDEQMRWFNMREIVFSRDPDDSVRMILGTAEDITRRKSVEEQLAWGAMYDNLTNLPNRRYFMNKLRAAIEKQSKDSTFTFAVLFLDIDRFKIINDSLGHDIGDQLLIAIAERLQTSMQENDIVARLGGDEFTILMQNTVSNREIIKRVEKIQKKLSVPFKLNHLKMSANCSIGIAPSNQNYQEPEEILRDADTAMYRAKNKGKNCYALFNKQMHAHVLSFLQVEGDLRRALINNELEVYFQPIIDLKTSRIVTGESLIRWNHPVNGLTYPAQFLNVAEETGLMLQIDKFALFQSCYQNAAWQAEGLPNIRVAVNLSVNEIRQKRVRDLVTNILKQTKLNPKYLEVELTENVLIENSEANIETLKDLRKMGVNLSIDDFGTGYSSLTYITRLPSNTLKIDQSFIKNIVTDSSTAAIVKAIIDLAHNLNLKVISEGVETQEQYELVKSLNCDEAQGYFFSKPVPAEDFRELLVADAEKYS